MSVPFLHRESTDPVVTSDSMQLIDHTSTTAFGPGSGPIVFDGLDCSGNERYLDDCGTLPHVEGQCSHLNDIGVQCQGMYTFNPT